MTMPDVMLLPALADVFGISIDALFSREGKSESMPICSGDLPWPDDGVIRGVVFEGRTMLKREQLAQNRSAFASAEDEKSAKEEQTILDRVTFEIKGNVRDVTSDLKIEVRGDVMRNCTAGTSVNVGGDVMGGASAGTSVTCGGDLFGGCTAGTSVACGGDFYGEAPRETN